MNHGVKRYRQTSIFESFAFNKRAKGFTEETTSNQKQPMDNSLENISSSEGLANLQISKADDQSLNKNSASLLKEELSATSDAEDEMKNDEDAVKPSKSVFDLLWETEDEGMKVNKNYQSVKKFPGSMKVNKNPQFVKENQAGTKVNKNHQSAIKTVAGVEVNKKQQSVKENLADVEVNKKHQSTKENLSGIEVNKKHQFAKENLAGIEVNKKSQSIKEYAILKSEIDESCGESSYKSSADLFPEEQSLEDAPSSSGGSQELFIDSQEELFESQTSTEETQETDESSSESETDDIVVLNRSPDCDLPLPKLEPSENHSIMFSPHIRPGDAPRPFPKSYRDVWDVHHVRMPCSSYNKYPVVNAVGEVVIGSRWDLVCESLLSDIQTSEDLEAAIMKYNSQQTGRWNFLGLHSLINEHWTEEERDHFFETLLPAMIEMVLSLPDICTQPVPLLKAKKDHSVTMSQKQIGSLLLNAFFCTFPRRNPKAKQRWNCEYASYPDINFNRLFWGTKRGCPRSNVEKLKCLFNYFKRITSKEPSGTVTFHRQVIPIQKFPNWYCSTRGIRTAVIKSHGLIEDDGQGFLQVDFANKYIGGGVIGQGCVQEEIRFVVSPELIVSRLFVECLENNEALIITGAEQYNKYSGYSDTFKWEGDFRDNIPRDSWGRRFTKIVAIDATHFRETSDQFRFQCFKRELNKAYCGFYENTPPNHLPAVATGNWGCGAFKGSPNLKFLIQLMAASECGRNLMYYTFKNRKLKKELQEVYEFLNDKNLSVGDLWRLLTNYTNHLNGLSVKKPIDLYSFIYSQFKTKKISPQEEKRNCNESTMSCKRASELLYDEITKDNSQVSDDIT